ncbi:sensor histidine kinase [Hyphomonas sp.]|uniref:sensor histidine kinase n=1 Tax=Hyphomonas sp. TaxID=87 RepID=UPI0037C1AE77
MAPGTAQKRLKFVHLAWIALGLTAAVSGGIGGAPLESLIAAMILTLIPGLTGFAVAGAGDTLRRGLLVIAWLVCALIAVLLTGGAASPLIVLLVAAPLAALLAGAPRMAAEAGTFAALALFAVFIATPAGWIPPPPRGAPELAAPFAFAGLVLASLKIWHLVSRSGAAPAAAPPAELPKGEPDPQPMVMNGISWIDVTPEGRLRRVQGDTFGLVTMRPGSALGSLFADHDFPLPPPGRTGRKLATVELVSGQRVRVIAERHAKGCYLLMVDSLDEAPALPYRAVADLEAKLQSRTAFFASLGHELKTPLNAILGYAEVMQAELMGPMPKPYADYPSIIHESGTDLLLLVDDILDLARSEAGQPRLEPEPVDLTASAESVIRQLTGQADRLGITLKLKSSEEVWAEADARAVRQIWQNLVSNAIKYSASGKTVTLETRLDNGAALLSVTDRGAGIAAADLGRLTEPFAQGTGAKPGTGLGLSVVRRFAELHGGSLRITSKPGKGTRVEVTLPRALEADIAPIEEAAE